MVFSGFVILDKIQKYEMLPQNISAACMQYQEEKCNYSCTYRIVHMYEKLRKVLPAQVKQNELQTEHVLRYSNNL